MSKLDELIKRLCPNCVEHIELNKVLDYEQPTKYIVKNTNYHNDFDTPVLTAGQTFLLGYTNEQEGIYAADNNNPTIIFDDFTTSFHWVNFNFKIKSSAMKMLRVKSEKKCYVSFRYIYHCMKNINYDAIDHSRQWIGKYSLIKIPIPPLAIQEEITSILDTFNEITAELTAELKSRKKQYDYYRDNLFRLHSSVKYETLKDVSLKITSGGTPKTGRSEYWNNGIIPWMTSGEVNLKSVWKTEKYITELGLKNSSAKLIPKNSIVIALAGQGKTRGKVAKVKIDLTTNQSLAAIIVNKDKIISDYLYYFLTMNYEHLRQISSGNGNRGGLNLSMISNYKIPLPSIEEQQRIVDILDRFDTLCNDISKGLPAEIKMRQQQYEYYRDKLLNFKELES